jgi:putative iron-dependent peroxidase
MSGPTLQPAIWEPSFRLARLQVFALADADADPRPGLRALCERAVLPTTVLGVGQPLCERLGVAAGVPGLRAFPALTNADYGIDVPSTQGAVLCVLGADDRGELVHASRAAHAALGSAFTPLEVIDAFTYREGRDLTGYLDGTENPKDDAARDATRITGQGAGLDGGTFVALQRWLHDLDGFERNSPSERDAIIGRDLQTNQELADAPASAHVKRAAQESFEPQAFMLRRSMPFATATEAGLAFVAYGRELDRFERVLRRMLGLDDGVVDALFKFSRPQSGGYYFCPPTQDGRFDLRALGLG